MIKTNVFVSHGRLLNLFQLKGVQFMLDLQHFRFEADIRMLFKLDEDPTPPQRFS